MPPEGTDCMAAREPAPQKHPLDFADVAVKVVITIIGSWFAISSFYQKKASDEKLFQIQQANNFKILQHQIDSQTDTYKDQKQTAEKQLTASLMPWFKCDAATLRTVPFLYLRRASPSQATDVSNAIADCTQDPVVRQKAEELSIQSSLQELDQQFYRQLNIARRYRNYGLQQSAAEEYQKAYNELPKRPRSGLDDFVAAKARKAFDNGDFQSASDLFEQLFARIGTAY
jgi:hypothetical protein